MKLLMLGRLHDYRQIDKQRVASMVWAKPEYSKKQVKRAGEFLCATAAEIFKPDFIERLEEALAVLNNWRSSHSYPVNTFQATLRAKLRRMGVEATVAQRLKRTPSIIGKLRRFQDMSLPRMQDIGGLRAVVPTVQNVRQLHQMFLQSRFEHELVGVKDYIEQPKQSGYRGIHLIYRYNNRKGHGPDYKGLQVEIQLRSKMQHSWATAVETAGLFLGQALKSSIGNDRWLEFFSYASSAFALLEKTPVFEGHRNMMPSEIYGRVIELESELNVINRLNMFKAAVDYRDAARKDYHYFLMRLDPVTQQSVVKGFSRAELDLANTEYLRQEKELQSQDETGIQVVLVAAQSLESLKRAYPNYFMDTGEFVMRLKRIGRVMGQVAALQAGLKALTPGLVKDVVSKLEE